MNVLIQLFYNYMSTDEHLASYVALKLYTLYVVANLHFISGLTLPRGPALAIKIGPTGPHLAIKVVWEDQF